ncbi:hypothetical protein LINPERPRIM_LOCUS1493, partial [Linum perenne]
PNSFICSSEFEGKTKGNSATGQDRIAAKSLADSARSLFLLLLHRFFHSSGHSSTDQSTTATSIIITMEQDEDSDDAVHALLHSNHLHYNLQVVWLKVELAKLLDEKSSALQSC